MDRIKNFLKNPIKIATAKCDDDDDYDDIEDFLASNASSTRYYKYYTYYKVGKSTYRCSQVRQGVCERVR